MRFCPHRQIAFPLDERKSMVERHAIKEVIIAILPHGKRERDARRAEKYYARLVGPAGAGRVETT